MHSSLYRNKTYRANEIFLCLCSAFGEARGYPVERDIYLNALQGVQRGEKIDTSKVALTPSPVGVSPRKSSMKMRSLLKNSVGRPMGPPGFAMSRRGFVNGGPFSHQRYGMVGPPGPLGFGPMPPPLGMPPIPPMSPPHYRPRPFRYGPPPPPMRQAIPPTPPGLGFPRPGFPPRMPGPPRMAGRPRLSAGPAARLLPPKMPPPPPPPSRAIRTTKQLQAQKKQQIRNGIIDRANIHMRRNRPVSNRILPKVYKEQDFTVDTFEENLLTNSILQPRRQSKGRFNQSK